MPVVLITGCSSGFGLLSAVSLAKQGAQVFATMRNPARDAALRQACAEAGVSVDVLQLDVTDPPSIAAAVASVIERAGRIDVLVNNAGVGGLAPVEEWRDDEILRLFDTNVFGLIRVTREVLPHMRAQRSGRIVNIGSLAGVVSTPFRAIYSATKHAVEAITDGLYYELHPFGVHVCVVEPGFFATAIDQNYIPLRRDPARSPYADLEQKFHAAMSGSAGSGNRADPQAVADVIVQAATDEQPRRRYLAGKDAEAIAPMHKQMSDEDFERVMRQALNLWD
ncbi:MAG TPA: SDR family oxidoreductase [Dehalococcoidia bacterium]|nr:SDR family oxidoreductase [Dehalococcoidia bacterium]